MASDQLPGLARILRAEVDRLIEKWEGGSAYVSAGRISDLAKEIADVKNERREPSDGE